MISPNLCDAVSKSWSSLPVALRPALIDPKKSSKILPVFFALDDKFVKFTSNLFIYIIKTFC